MLFLVGIISYMTLILLTNCVGLNLDRVIGMVQDVTPITGFFYMPLL